MEKIAGIEEIKALSGKKLAGLDFGLKRIGFAVSDELHITSNSRGHFEYDSKEFWAKFLDQISREKIGAFVVGFPYREDGEKTELIKELEKFIIALKEKTGLDVFIQDESFSSVKAVRVMLQIGDRKKKRAKKGRKDEVAAALILRDFLNEMEQAKIKYNGEINGF